MDAMQLLPGLGGCPLLVIFLNTWCILTNTPGVITATEVIIKDVSHVNGYVHLSFYPASLVVIRGNRAVGFINVTVRSDVTPEMPLKLHLCCVDPDVAQVIHKSHIIELPRNQTNTIFNITTEGVVLGRTEMRFYISRNASLFTPDYNRTSYSIIKPDTGGVTSAVTQAGQVIRRDSGPETWTPGESMPSLTTVANPADHVIRNLDIDLNINNANISRSYDTVSEEAKPITENMTKNSKSPIENLARVSRSATHGVTNFNISNYPDENLQIWWLPTKYHIIVQNPINPAEETLNYIVMVFIAVNFVGIGGQLDTEEVLYLLKRPMAVGAALFCRFGVLPALALGLVELLQPSKLVSLGVLGLVCSPSEGANNLLILLLEGDLTLSATVTTINNFATVAMLPLWTILFETRIYQEPGRASIPFKEIFIIFGYLTAALAVGSIIQKRFTKHYNRFWVYLPGFSVLTLLFLVAVQFYNNYFIFQLVTVQIFLLSSMLAACGFVFGASVAFIARQPKARILVLAVETGTRTTYITALLLTASLSSPDGDIAKTTPVLSSFLTLFPTITAVLIFRIIHKYKTRNYTETECSYLASQDDLSELCNGPEVVDTKETSI